MNSPMGGFFFDVSGNTVVSTFETPSELKLLGENLTRSCVEYSGASQAWFAQIDENKQIDWVSSYPENEKPIKFKADIQEKMIRGGGKPIFLSQEISTCTGIFPIQYHRQVIGLLVLRSSGVDFFTDSVIGWIEVLLETVSFNLVQLRKIACGKQISNLIQHILQFGLSLRDNLPSLLRTLSDMVGADSALIYRRAHTDPKRYDLFATYGLVTPMVKSLPLLSARIMAMTNGAPIQLKNLADEPEEKRLRIFAHEGYQAYIPYPLISEGSILGVLEIFWRVPREDGYVLEIVKEIGETLSWVFAYTMTIDNLKRSNKELLSTHIATLEGLSRALELRDPETDGHTQRVCNLTLQLAKHMKIPEDQHASLFQGALLHDIGKLGIPDAILLKPGSLTPQEWEIMKQHPQHAYNILAPIIGLQQALDIPLYHHERWDGTGYPFGLEGEQIPLFARLFAVVDVFDALTSDRPYRLAWSRAQALAYIRKNSGKLFDPQIVAKFLDFIDVNHWF